ncbi:MAG TPA: hypothetical protein VK791_02385 [bacterium]|nr:hypothetical protein [bacterium]
MMIKILLFVSVLLAGSMGWAMAQTATPMPAHKVARARIFELKDRIKSQRERITMGLEDGSLTPAQAQSCREILDVVAKQINDEAKANGARKTMRHEKYEAYNTSLDVNSAFIHEQKQTYYYYDSAYDEHGY